MTTIKKSAAKNTASKTTVKKSNDVKEKTSDVKSKKVVEPKPYIAPEFETNETEKDEILSTEKTVKEFSSLAKFEKKEKKEKELKEKTVKRTVCTEQAIRELCVKGATMQAIMDRSDAIYVSKGGKSNPTATNVNRYMIEGLIAFNVVKKVDNLFFLV